MAAARERVLTGSDALLVLVKLAPPAATSDRGFADPNQVADLRHLNQLFDAFAEAHPVDTRVLDLGAIVCPEGSPCPAVVDGITLRPTDGGHFSRAGAAWVAPRLLDEVLAVAG
jgi:lysophospholipase L1-like esterase